MGSNTSGREIEMVIFMATEF